MVSSLVVICYTFQIEAGNYVVRVVVHAFYTFDVSWALDCLSIPISDLVLDGEGTASNLAGGSLNEPPGLSLITSVFVSTLTMLHFLKNKSDTLLATTKYLADIALMAM